MEEEEEEEEEEEVVYNANGAQNCTLLGYYAGSHGNFSPRRAPFSATSRWKPGITQTELTRWVSISLFCSAAVFTFHLFRSQAGVDV
jgi:hypothetical protein